MSWKDLEEKKKKEVLRFVVGIIVIAGVIWLVESNASNQDEKQAEREIAAYNEAYSDGYNAAVNHIIENKDDFFSVGEAIYQWTEDTGKLYIYYDLDEIADGTFPYDDEWARIDAKAKGHLESNLHDMIDNAPNQNVVSDEFGEALSDD